jgi:hypothetical protein
VEPELDDRRGRRRSARLIERARQASSTPRSRRSRCDRISRIDEERTTTDKLSRQL